MGWYSEVSEMSIPSRQSNITFQNLTNCKCEFDHNNPGLPCKRCVSKGYTCSEKTLGPKSQKIAKKDRFTPTVAPLDTTSKPETTLGLSRPLTKYDPSIDPKDIMSLQLVFSEKFPAKTYRDLMAAALIPIISSVYGSSIVHVGLRHAILSFISLCRDEPIQQLEHDLAANLALQRKLTHRDHVDEGDLWATFFLGLWDTSNGNTNEDSVTAHRDGFISIMETLSERVRGEIKNYDLAVFWPFARDTWFTDHSNHSDRYRRILGMPSYKQIEVYTSALPNVIWIQRAEPAFLANKLRRVFEERFELATLLLEQARRNGVTSSGSNTPPPPSFEPSQWQAMSMQTYLRLPDFLLNFLAAVSDPVDSMSSDHKATLLCMSQYARMAASIALISHLNNLLRYLLEKPSILEGLLSLKANLEMSAITILITEIGGVVFLDHKEFSEGGDVDCCLEFWNYLVPKAGQMFLERTYPNGLAG
jgi:hypothetical protein